VARLRDVVVDCRHPASLARFWAAALDGYDVAPYDEAELQRLRDTGVHGPEDDPTVLVEGSGVPRFWFQLVPEPTPGKNRLHVDVVAGDLDAEIDRLVGLGARVVATRQRHGTRWVTCTDPEGNEFCVFPD
jgi:hypothetical protein